jgi:DNA invertase Pin-like site-specific DNA recombinase
MNTSELIQPCHLARRAVIYVRQSSPHQVYNNQESRRLQYALTRRAVELGWSEHDIQVIDTDLGHTAATTDGRAGFQQLVTQVALSEVGILIAYDATRLARNCSHWYQLLDLCSRADSLIADRDGVYDPASINGRLLLGLKGQISELELHTIRARLTAGILSKARRGELALTLPAGLVRLPTGVVAKHPDAQVQSRLALVFQTLLEQRSIARVVHFFRDHELKIPRQEPLDDILWKRPTVASISSIVKNPAYAGAFVYGRRRSQRSTNTGQMRQKLLPQQEWRICIRDKYPAYIPWETFETIQTMLRDNYSEYDRNKTRGVPRDGKALLQGLIYCGECGHKMFIQYKGGTRYLCNHLRQQHREPVCQYLPADPIDQQVVQWFFEALSAAQIDLAAQTLQEADRRRDQLLLARRQEVQRLQYQSRLTERQFQQSDPDNRLVTAELERRWELALRELKEAQEKLRHDEQHASSWAIPAELIGSLKQLGPRLPQLWTDGLFSTAQKKALLRSLIDKVVLHRVGGDHVRTRVVWRGGATTTQDVPVPVGSLAQLSDAQPMQQAVVRLAREGRTDQQIAQELTAQGHRSPMRYVVLPSTVKNIRLQHGVLLRPSQSHPRHVPGYLTIPQIARKLGLSRQWIHDRIHNGTIRVNKDARTRCYLFPDHPDTLAKFRQLQAGQIRDLGC